jgi:hypothetical protein
MFSHFFLSKKSGAANALFFVRCLTLILALSGCGDGNKMLSELPIGNWLSSYGEEFTVTSSRFTSGFAGKVTYAGDITRIRQDGNGAGYITIKYTSNQNNVSAVGMYYVIRWRNNTGESVELSGAAKAPDYGDGKATEAAAEAEYTVANGYFPLYSACRKR